MTNGGSAGRSPRMPRVIASFSAASPIFALFVSVNAFCACEPAAGMMVITAVRPTAKNPNGDKHLHQGDAGSC